MAKKRKASRLVKWILSVAVVIIVVLATVVSINQITVNKNKSSATAKDDNYVLKLADSSGLCEAPQQIAIEKGIFKKYGIKYKNVKIGDLSGTEALTAGKVDATNSLLASVVQPLTNGAELKITTGLHTGCLQILVGKNSKIKSIKDLKGKKIGVGTVAGSPATFAKRVLSYNGLNVSTKNSDVQFIQYDSASLPIVLSKGQVDAIAVGDPDTQIAIKNYGFTSLASSATTAPFNKEYCCVAYVSNKLAKEHPEIARKFTLALQEAAEWIANHRDESVHIQTDKKYIAGDEKTNLSALETYKWEPSFTDAKKAFKQTADSLQDIGVISKDVDTQALTDHSFLKFKGVK